MTLLSARQRLIRHLFDLLTIGYTESHRTSRPV